jgi:2'-5' RNA ligase
MKRLFIAIPVVPEAPLTSLADQLRTIFRNEKINWVPLQNLHFTLQFLGDTHNSRIPGIIDRTGDAVKNLTAAKGNLKGLGYFMQNRIPSVLYTKLEDMPEMAAMASAIRRGMEAEGFSPDIREFKSHLTLGRIKFLKDAKLFLETVEKLRNINIQEVSASEINVYESLLRPEGPVYRKLAVFPLRAPG